jgi:hypothetical protein
MPGAEEAEVPKEPREEDDAARADGADARARVPG